MPRIPRKSSNKTYTQFDPKIHTKTKGGHGFGMKKGIKDEEFQSSGLHLAKVFGWEIPDKLKPRARKLKII